MDGEGGRWVGGAFGVPLSAIPRELTAISMRQVGVDEGWKDGDGRASCNPTCLVGNPKAILIPFPS